MVISTSNTVSSSDKVDEGTTKVISATWTSNLKSTWEDIPNFFFDVSDLKEGYFVKLTTHLNVGGPALSLNSWFRWTVLVDLGGGSSKKTYIHNRLVTVGTSRFRSGFGCQLMKHKEAFSTISNQTFYLIPKDCVGKKVKFNLQVKQTDGFGVSINKVSASGDLDAIWNSYTMSSITIQKILGTMTESDSTYHVAEYKPSGNDAVSNDNRSLRLVDVWEILDSKPPTTTKAPLPNKPTVTPRGKSTTTQPPTTTQAPSPPPTR